jgi:hypothetical protein
MEVLAEGDASARRWSADSYFNQFFDLMPFDDEKALTSQAMTANELKAVECVRSLMIEASNSLPKSLKASELVASGWPTRVAEKARLASKLFNLRGHRPTGWIPDPRDLPTSTG